MCRSCAFVRFVGVNDNHSHSKLVLLLREQAPAACRQEARRGDGEPRRETSGVCYRHGHEENRPGHLPGAIQALRLLYQIRWWLSHPRLWPGQNHLDIVDTLSTPACIHLLQLHSYFSVIAGLNCRYALLFRRVQSGSLCSRTVALLKPSSLNAGVSHLCCFVYVLLLEITRADDCDVNVFLLWG